MSPCFQQSATSYCLGLPKTSLIGFLCIEPHLHAFKEERLASILSIGGTWPKSRTCIGEIKAQQRRLTPMSHNLSTQVTLSASAATTPLAFSKFAIASLHVVDFAIADCKVAGSDQACNIDTAFSNIGQADITYGERSRPSQSRQRRKRGTGDQYVRESKFLPKLRVGTHRVSKFLICV